MKTLGEGDRKAGARMRTIRLCNRRAALLLRAAIFVHDLTLEQLAARLSLGGPVAMSRDARAAAVGALGRLAAAWQRSDTAERRIAARQAEDLADQLEDYVDE